jgi:hypothetical protein
MANPNDDYDDEFPEFNIIVHGSPDDKYNDDNYAEVCRNRTRHRLRGGRRQNGALLLLRRHRRRQRPVPAGESPPRSSSLSSSSSLTMKNLSISLTPPVIVVVISARTRLTRMHQVRDLRRELESTNDRLLEVEADASASQIKSARCNDLIKRQAAEWMRLVKKELRRTRLKAERYRSGWMRLSGGGGGGGRGGRKRRADAAKAGSGDFGGGGGGSGVNNGSRMMADMGRSGRKMRRRPPTRTPGDPTPPLHHRQSICGSIVGRGGDAPIGQRGGLARRRRHWR